MQSSLLVRLRTRKSKAKKGLHAQVAKWGEDVTDAIIESKEADEEKAKAEIRRFPDATSKDPVHLQVQCMHDNIESRFDIKHHYNACAGPDQKIIIGSPVWFEECLGWALFWTDMDPEPVGALRQDEFPVSPPDILTFNGWVPKSKAVGSFQGQPCGTPGLVTALQTPA